MPSPHQNKHKLQDAAQEGNKELTQMFNTLSGPGSQQLELDKWSWEGNNMRINSKRNDLEEVQAIAQCQDCFPEFQNSALNQTAYKISVVNTLLHYHFLVKIALIGAASGDPTHCLLQGQHRYICTTRKKFSLFPFINCVSGAKLQAL